MAATILQRVVMSTRVNICNAKRSNLFTYRNIFISRSFLRERRYTDKHEWVMLDEKGNTGIIGITNYAQEALGDVVFAQLPDVGTEFNAMDECGALESVKAASELYCPLSGKIADKNVSVEQKPALINKSCYDQGWLFRIELAKPEELDNLMSEEQYNKFLKDQNE
uniref:Glycine cleavage system H protein n=1 Tax=Strigamia maritima TaxID=126957 RepID=T1J4Y5_STRMM